LKRHAGVEGRGVLHYPLLRRTVNVELTDEQTTKLKSVIKDIGQILSEPNPPSPVKAGYCRKCSYNELCWGME
jgi:CRISPR-associated exonuclease Cas4